MDKTQKTQKIKWLYIFCLAVQSSQSVQQRTWLYNKKSNGSRLEHREQRTNKQTNKKNKQSSDTLPQQSIFGSEELASSLYSAFFRFPLSFIEAVCLFVLLFVASVYEPAAVQVGVGVARDWQFVNLSSPGSPVGCRPTGTSGKELRWAASPS